MDWIPKIAKHVWRNPPREEGSQSISSIHTNEDLCGLIRRCVQPVKVKKRGQYFSSSGRSVESSIAPIVLKYMRSDLTMEEYDMK